MKYLHIMNFSNYVVSSNFISFIEEFFVLEEHFFVFIGSYDEKYKNLFLKKNIIYVDNQNKLLTYMKKCGMVILHSLNINSKLRIKCILNHNIMNKIVWISWGGDLYLKKQKKFSLKFFLYDCIKRNFIRKLKKYATIFAPDSKYFAENYKSEARIYNVSYVGGIYMDVYKREFFFNSINDKKIIDAPVRIMIGHQANPELNHIEVLNKLSQYNEENIEIYLPLSYGDKSNAINVEKEAHRIFGKKVHIIKKWMALDEYDSFLEEMDIAIFDTERQIALGNINKLLFMHKKIYLRNNSVMYNYYRDNGVYIADSEKIGKISYKEFISDFDSSTGHDFVKNKVINKEQKIMQWKNLFEN